jgi:serine/threonine-protein kinase
MIDMDFAPTAEILPKARAAADRALELDPNSAEAHTARGLVAHELEWDQARARRAFLRAIELNPNYAYGIHWYAHYLEFEGREEEAEAQMKRALAIDPLSRILTADLAMIQWKLRRYEAALKLLDRTQELDPDYYLLDASRGLIFESQRDWSRAREAFSRARQRMQDAPPVLSMVAHFEALSGDVAAARRDLAALRTAAAKMYVPDHFFALVEYALNEREQGNTSLKKSIDAHSGLLVWLKTTPLFDDIAKDPKGAELMRQIGR